MLKNAQASNCVQSHPGSVFFIRFMVFICLPAAAVLGQSSVALPTSLAAESAQVVNVKYIANYCEGPAGDAAGNIYFSDFAGARKIWKVPRTGDAMVFLADGEGCNGLEFDPEDRLVATQKDKLTRFNKDGSKTVLAKSGGGFDLKDLNDLSIASTGAMYFSNHSSGNTVFYRGTDGTMKKTAGLQVPNGVEWIEEKNFLYVCLSNGNKVVKYAVKSDGALENPKDFATVATPDGLTVDEQGNVYVASYSDGAIMVFDSTGKSLGKIKVKSAIPSDLSNSGNTSNCTFGGVDYKTLYITGDGGLYKVDLKVAGRRRPGHTSQLRRSVSDSRLSGFLSQPLQSGMTASLFDVRNAKVGEWTSGLLFKGDFEGTLNNDLYSTLLRGGFSTGQYVLVIFRGKTVLSSQRIAAFSR